MKLRPHRRTLAATAGVLAMALAACSAWSIAGASTDAGEPVVIGQAGTYAFPIVLDRPGRYRLATDLSVPAGSAGIVISAAGVDLDLGGFAVRGPVRCATLTAEVRCDAEPRMDISGIYAKAAGVTVRHGSVHGFAGSGVRLDRDGRVDDLLVSGNAAAGIHANTSPSRPVDVRNVQAARNGEDGFWLQTGSLAHVSALGNGRSGFALGPLARLEDGSAAGNKGFQGDVLPMSAPQDAVAPAPVTRLSMRSSGRPSLH